MRKQTERNRNMRNRHFSIRIKMTVLVFVSFFILSFLNVLIYSAVRGTINNIDTVYEENEQLNELMDNLKLMNNSVFLYLETKSTDALMNYYEYEQEFVGNVDKLNHEPTSDEVLLLEKNIYNLSYTYIIQAQSTLEAKRARNTSRYKEAYEITQEMFEDIEYSVKTLNNNRFLYNSDRYKMFRNSLDKIFVISIIIWIIIFGADILFLVIMTRSITKPLIQLTKSAAQVETGDFNVSFPVIDSGDELETLSKGFNKMIVSIREYIAEIKLNHEKQTKMIETELNMKNDLQEAQLKYLQAQINPHFLFNTLNAGTQLAMMEGAERTSEFIQNVADFFRYNVQNIERTSTIREELQLVDSYIYILNVRFSGEIHYRKIINEKLLDRRLPGMILQPIVENSVNHGLRGSEKEEIIEIKVYETGGMIRISVYDNGRGIEQQKLKKIRNGQNVHDETGERNSGIGLTNVINRLNRYYNRSDIFEIESGGLDKGTTVNINIPI